MSKQELESIAALIRDFALYRTQIAVFADRKDNGRVDQVRPLLVKTADELEARLKAALGDDFELFGRFEA